MEKSARFYITFSLILIALIFSSCSPKQSQAVNTNTPEGTVMVDRTFREFYQNLGGIRVLGPAITELFPYNEIQCQYTENALMCFNPLATDTDRFTLYPLGTGFNINDLPEATTVETTEERVVDGYHIFEEFQPMYDSLFGARYVGRPLTQVRYNPLEQRIEQYFENVGFYRRIDDSPGDVHLLAYGVFACNARCRYTATRGSAVTNLPENIDLPFLPYFSSMADPSAFGEPLTTPFNYENDQLQQVYENAVIAGNPSRPDTVHLLNIPIRLGFPQFPPGPQIYSTNQGVVFYPVQGADGYHVPLVFDEFIVRHGGLDFSGNPIGEVYQVNDEIFRQCFENYCLDYLKNAEEGKKVAMVAIGESYLESLNVSQDLVVKFTFSPESVLLTVSEKWAHVSSSDQQEIDLLVLRVQDQSPLDDVEAALTLTLPDNSTRNYNFPPTDAYGQSTIVLPALKNVENGSVIAYKVCLNVPSETPICKEDSFLIWAP